MFAPINGIDLDRYVELRRTIVADGAGAPARLARLLDAAGLTATA